MSNTKNFGKVVGHGGVYIGVLPREKIIGGKGDEDGIHHLYG